MDIEWSTKDGLFLGTMDLYCMFDEGYIPVAVYDRKDMCKVDVRRCSFVS